MHIFIVLLLLLAPLRVVAEEVDVELFLAVDVSRSMSPDELEIQRRGYAEALQSSEVMAAIQNGLIGNIAITYVEWAGAYSQQVIVPWTKVATPEDAARVASRITSHFADGMRRTSISDALMYAAEDLERNHFEGLRRVIDVSGDGPNNQGRPVLHAREHVLSKGIIINGLPLMTQDALSSVWGIEDLDLYYQNCVIGGPGAFMIPVLDWDQFADAVRRKLVLEIAGLPPRIVPAQMTAPADYNCLIGEEIWQRNRIYFDSP
ncbi:DUF1194 domain-containing protein [Thalassococcus sp. S3]|uniref:DUF1194 domain-containing protein n=1 Tax=Thalassococcus sp. S3 TaxID=2017482 RepID=UPI001023F4A1|nr:DUF1194 domain-containing protein [Thalassococcus sp. S3]QBF31396.1 hypothetical protein CFI11_09210 [Thalassococcus sp. S3]